MSRFNLITGNRRSRLTTEKTGWIGVDIGTGAIKIAQVEQTAGRCRIARSVIVRAKDGTLFDSAAIEDGRVGEEIRDAISLHGGFTGRSAACLVSMAACELRTLISAKGSEDDQRELISLELQQDTSLAAEPKEFDFWDCATEQQDDAQGMTQVHVVSVPRSLADGVGNALLDSGLRCEVLDTVPFCAMRAMEIDGTSVTSDTEFSRSQAILDLGFSAATLIILHEGQPVLARCLRDCGLSGLFARTAERLKLSRCQTDALLMNHGLRKNGHRGEQPDELRDLIVELALPLLHDLTEELLQTLEFLKMQFADYQPDRLVISGGGGAIPGMSEQLQATLRMPVREWQLPLRSADANQPEPILANAAALSALAWEL